MICAAEYMDIKLKAEAIAELARLMREEEKRKRLEEIHNYTKEFCDNELNQILIDNANNNNLETILWYGTVFEYHYGIDSYGMIYESDTRYANGEKSFNVESENTIDLEYLIEYLNQHCFEVTTTPHNYKHYGSGEKEGFDIIITPQPFCE